MLSTYPHACRSSGCVGYPVNVVLTNHYILQSLSLSLALLRCLPAKMKRTRALSTTNSHRPIRL